MTGDGENLAGMVAVVTGASGFIGSHLVEALVRAGAQVRVLQRPASAEFPTPDGVTSFVADLRNEAVVVRSPAWSGATHCFHLAGVTKARTRAAFDAANVAPTRGVCSAIEAQGRRELRLVYVSSQAAAGPAVAANAPVREDDAPHPVEAYGESKCAAERVVERHHARCDAVVIRPAAVYGPRDRDFLALFRQATSRVAIHAAPRAQQFSIVHVHDLVRALIAAATRPEAAGRRYFVCHEHAPTWRQLSDEVARAAGTHPIDVQIPRPMLRVAAMVADGVSLVTGRALLLNRHKVALTAPWWWLCDAARARDELAWRPRIGLVEGIRDTLAWYRGAGWLAADGG